MTEKDWLECDSPGRMLEYLKRCRRYTVAGRQVLLFGCRAVRRIAKKLAYQESEDAIRVAERFADGRATALELTQARRAARSAINATTDEDGGSQGRGAAEAAWCLTRLPSEQRLDRIFLLNTMQELVGCVVRAYWYEPEKRERELAAQAELIREVIGNPFQRVKIDPVWLTWNDRGLVRIADTIYNERHWDEMPILADALEEAGCTDAAMLDHCRAERTHCRGCWLLDAVLGNYREEKTRAARGG